MAADESDLMVFLRTTGRGGSGSPGPGARQQRILRVLERHAATEQVGDHTT